jgi:hypothetical protein
MNRSSHPLRTALIVAAAVLGTATAVWGGTATGGAAKTFKAPSGWQAFGAGVSSAPVVPVATLLGAAPDYAGKTVVVEGPVSGVCQNKGCWLTMQHADKEMRVRFKDYAFFVPKNCAGKKARVEGVLAIEKIPVDEARHYLQDAGKNDAAAKITEPVDGYTFMASGVLLQK